MSSSATTATGTTKPPRVFCGTVVHSTKSAPMNVLENAALGVKDGKVIFLDSKDNLQALLTQHGLDSGSVVNMTARQFLMPGLVDCHIHSPQLPIQGLGTDLGLLDWLQTYTFPSEARYKDPTFARAAHRTMVMRSLRGGTTSSTYFSSIHTDTTLFLCQAAEELGQRAFVGKVNMDQSSPDYYIETTDGSISETKRFVSEAQAANYSLVTPIITPRFAISCTERLMKELGVIARSHDLPIQTHLSETVQEIETTLSMFPGHKTYTDLYDAMGLLGPKTILAHCVHMSDPELDLLNQRGCGVVHCACSNTTLRSGLMNIRHQLDRGVKLALGTDMGAGYSTSILDAMRHSVDVSNTLAIEDQQRQRTQAAQHRQGQATPPAGSSYQPLTMEEAFKLATRGGSTVMGQNCGNFEVGREFDALLVDPEVKNTPLDLFSFDSAKEVVLKFLYFGDDRNMIKIYVQGREVVDKTSEQGFSS